MKGIRSGIIGLVIVGLSSTHAISTLPRSSHVAMTPLRSIARVPRATAVPLLSQIRQSYLRATQAQRKLVSLIGAVKVSAPKADKAESVMAPAAVGGVEKRGRRVALSAAASPPATVMQNEPCYDASLAIHGVLCSRKM
ncbi:unnamed protein product [Vitrella brassicaformis CCMP3155]|uniref:Uncharacterized protein n=2 Tax=Vitrella brassicaformis TaxID=1169539 RepID=A0A0G4EWC9_VITBC|nr:unnamed protein product [Vitrella brassicaformis CCMP3155]|mmetsp:Transcript_9999/g.28871  ORF Transcript_9999/g.28871 Transcript_9999/m.28871 type:complete len:139 (+) Transcript_9999:199-615(+)|eukprot:CEM02558.1 unnamed protein product [Vitrella brassicaformis CCMP3155]